MHLRERPITSAVLPSPAPLPNLRDALQRRAAIFGPVEIDDAPVTQHGPLALSAQPSACPPRVNVDRLGGGDLDLAVGRRSGAGNHGRVLRQHHLCRGLCVPLVVLGRAAAVVRHLCLPTSSWLA